MNRPLRTTRGGTSLVEALIIMAVGAVVLGGVVTGTTSLLRVNKRIVQADDNRRLLLTLASQVRNDLHGAQACEWNPDEQRLIITGPEGARIEYQQSTGRVERRGAQTTTPWRIPPGTQLRGRPGRCATSELFELELERSIATHPLRIVALVGRDAQQVSSEEASP